jgi:hypothetical protein
MSRASEQIEATSIEAMSTTPSRPTGRLKWQWTLGQIVTTVVAAGMEILHLGEYPQPLWRAGGISAAAWDGRLPNAFALLARRT